MLEGGTRASASQAQFPNEPRASRLKILVVCGGDDATNSRHELLAWLRGPDHDLDARIVADEPPHSGRAVDDRVDAMIDWADAAIALVTPDERTSYGAPNVIDEIGRWRGRHEKETLCIVRKKGVAPYSNHNGIVYVGFEDRVREAFEGLRRFLTSVGALTLDSERGNAANGWGSALADVVPVIELREKRKERTSRVSPHLLPAPFANAVMVTWSEGARTDAYLLAVLLTAPDEPALAAYAEHCTRWKRQTGHTDWCWLLHLDDPSEAALKSAAARLQIELLSVAEYCDRLVDLRGTRCSRRSASRRSRSTCRGCTSGSAQR